MGNDAGTRAGTKPVEATLARRGHLLRERKREESKADNEILATTVVQALASSNPARCPGGVEGSDVSIASPVATFR